MRELIHPALFIVARTGIYLAAVAWIAATFLAPNPISFAFTTPSNSISLDINGAGWSFDYETPVTRSPDSDYMVWKLPGLTISAPYSGLGIRVSHWFAITLFTLFYICLKLSSIEPWEARRCEN